MTNGLGNVRALLNSSGVPTDLYHYDSWGNPIPTGTETTRQPFRWNGAYGYEDVELTKLYHVGAREYDPKTRRWLQSPLDSPLDWRVYTDRHDGAAWGREGLHLALVRYYAVH